MLSVLGITFPIFAAIGIGYGLRAIGFFSSDDIRVLSRFVFNVALPALLFGAVAGRDLGEFLDWGYIAAVALGGLFTALILFFGLGFSGTGPARRAIAAMGSCVSNNAFIGYPILLLALPDVANRALAMNFLCDNFILFPLTSVLLELSRPRSGVSIARVVLRSFATLLKRPFLIALMLGILVSLIGIPLPQPVERLSLLIGGAASATSLIVAGASLYGMPMGNNRSLAALTAATKLLLHPALAFAFLSLFAAVGLFAVEPRLAAAALLSAGVPTFATLVVMSEPYGHEGLAALTVLFALIGSFVTISIFLAVLT